jgi:3-hydroxybutyryl-CoA dehydrogenase
MTNGSGTVLVAGDAPLADELAAWFAKTDRRVVLYGIEAGGVGPAGVERASDLVAAAGQADLVVECTVWPFDRKRQLVESLSRAVPDGAVVASMCTARSTSEIASWAAQPDRVVGFSVLPPLETSQIVEVAPGLQTAAEATEAIEGLFRESGRETARVRDDAGLVLGRIVCLIINEAAAMVMEGVASAREIDVAMKLGANYPRGPLEWADLIGIDFVYAVVQGVQAEQQEDRYRPCPLLRKMVLAGWLGRKSGRGFFEYADAVDQRR